MSASPLKPLALVAAIAGVVLFTNLGGPRLWDRDEPRNAGCAREMLARGDWVVPTFNGELRTHKPVLLYWGMMSAYRVLGVSEFAARLPSALAAMATVVCTFLIGRRLFGSNAGTWSAIALATSLLFVMSGRAATPDAVLIACTTLAMTVYVFGAFPRDIAAAETVGAPSRNEHWFPRRTWTVVAMNAAMGMAVLAKGPVGFLLPCAVSGLFLLFMRLPASHVPAMTFVQSVRGWLRPYGPRHFLATLWSMRPLTLIAVVVLVAGPWYWAVGAATEGQFLREFLLEHNVHRATSAMDGHAGNVFYYPVAILVGFFPWSVFTIPIVLDLRRHWRADPVRHPARSFALCWIGVYVVSFSIARTKLPSYVTPCFPALALLAGDYLSRWEHRAYSGRWLQVGFACFAVIGLVMCTAIPVAAHRFLPGEEWLGMIGLVPLMGGGACLWLASRHQASGSRTAFAASAVVLATLSFAFVVQRVDNHQQSHVLLNAIRTRAEQPRIASYYLLEPSWVFYSGRTISEFPRSDAAHGTEPNIPSNPAEQLVTFLEESPSNFVITRQTHARELESMLPPGVVVLAEADRFLSSQRLVVLGHSNQRSIEKPTAVVQQASAWSTRGSGSSTHGRNADKPETPAELKGFRF